MQIDGGGHENGLRSGTLNVPGIVGLGRALELCGEEMPAESARLSAMRDRLFEGLKRNLDGVRLNGPSSSAVSRTTFTSASTTSKEKRS